MSLDTLVALARVVFGLMFTVKLYFSVDARYLVWTHRLPFGSRRALHVMLGTLVLANVCFILGIATGPAALAQWALYLWLFRYASLYGLEDVSFHAISFYFVFAGAGARWSVDSLIGAALWGRVPQESVIPELALATVMGCIFLSAGVMKLRSPMWQRGLGAYYFFVLPNFRRCSTALIICNERVIRAINHLSLVMEIGLLPALLINAVPFGLAFWAMGIVFTILLSTVFVLTWIGEAMTVGLVIVFWLLWDTGTAGLGSRWVEEVAALDHGGELAVATLFLVTLLASLWTALMPDAGPLAGNPTATRLYRLARFTARFTWGFLPLDVFAESHMEGSIVYRVYARPQTGGLGQEVFRIYGPRCGPGPERFLRPTFYEVTSYKVAEACMEMDLYGKVKTPERRQFMLHLAQYIQQTVRASVGFDVASLTFTIIQLVPPPRFEGASCDWYLKQPWTTAFRIDFENGEARHIRPLVERILKAPTGRDLNRLSFGFLPLSN